MIGVLGGGQLGRMLALAGLPLGQRFCFLDPAEDAPAGEVGQLIVADYDDEKALDRLAELCDVVTYEFENVPATAAARLQGRVPLFPPPIALETAQDRLKEKELFRTVGLETPAFAPVDSAEDLTAALDNLGLPVVLKTRGGGYDGKGQVVIHDAADAPAALESLGGTHLIVEKLIDFDRELSVIAVAGTDGRIACYPLVENHHRDGILRLSLAPAPGLDDELQGAAQAYAAEIASLLGYKGVFAIEMFEDGSRLIGNELAPRVHNSGHWTIEGAETSQFENHLRAGLDLPLGSTEPVGFSAMVNLIGALPDPQRVAGVVGAHLHLYDKEPRPGRKLGHITLRCSDPMDLSDRLEQLAT